MRGVDEKYIRDFLAEHQIRFREVKDGDLVKLILEKDPFNESHKDAAIFINHKGRNANITFTCFHDSCKDKKLIDFLLAYDPQFMQKLKPLSSAKYETKSPDELKDIAKNIIQNVSQVEKRDVTWFLYPLIPFGNITVLAAEGGVGKSSIAVDLSAAVTLGRPPNFISRIPFEEDKDNFGNGTVLYLTSEDPVAEVLRERFERAGADLEKIRFVSFEREEFADLKFDSPLLEAIIQEARPALCIFDPIQSFILGKMAERNVMRQNLDHLTRLAKLYDCSFLLICHTNKSGTTEARAKISDSSDLWDKARSVLMVGNAKNEGFKFISQEKNNYDVLSDSFLFTIAEDGTIINQGRSEKRFADFAAEESRGRVSEAKDEAKNFIISQLRMGEKEVQALVESAKAMGISKVTLNRAKKEMYDERVIRYRQESAGKGQGVKWFISLDPHFK